jgi:hypothetical protein
MGPSFKTLDIHLHPLPSAAVYAALPKGHAVLAFMDVGVEFVNRAAGVGALVFSGFIGCTYQHLYHS